MVQERDKLIIKCLRNNSRQTLASISRKTKIPKSTVYDRIRGTEKKLIKKYTSIVDFSKLGYSIRSKLLINVANPSSFYDFVKNNKNINTAHRIDGDFNYSIDCIFKEMKDMTTFLESLEKYKVLNKQTYFVVDEIKSEAFLNSSEEVE